VDFFAAGNGATGRVILTVRKVIILRNPH